MLEKVKDYLKSDEGVSEQDETALLERLRIQKRDYVKTALLHLTMCIKALKSADENRFSDRLLKLIDAEEQYSDDFSFMSNYPFFDDDLYIDKIIPFLSPLYNPPKDNIVELRYHLQTLWLYYFCIAPPLNDIPLPTALRIDYSMTLAVYVADSLSFLTAKEGATQDRLSLSKKALRGKKAEQMQTVVEEFFRVENRKEKTRHKIATDIRKQLKNKGFKAPSINTIKKYLEEDGCFI